MRLRLITLFICAICAFTLSTETRAEGKQPKYVFYLITDGTGVNTLLGTEMMQAELQGFIGRVPLCVSQFPVTSIASTHSFSHGITDSAASGTALATGKKTRNGMIGEGPDSTNVYSVAVWAKQAGRRVGVATSVNVNHATPAAFYAHNDSRNNYYEIAAQAAQAGFDFYGGSDFHKPTDKKNPEAPSAYEIAEKAGYTIARGYDDYLKKAKKAERMILFQPEPWAKVDPYSLPYYIDAKPGDMTIPQVMRAQLDFLAKDLSKGFLLVNEIGGKVDMACHSNDGATAFREVAAMDSCARIAYEFYKQHPDETLIVFTSDHETGGLVLAKDGSGNRLNMKVLANQKCSQDGLTRVFQKLRSQTNNNVTWEQVKEALRKNLGFWDAVKLNEREEKKLKDIHRRSFEGKMPNEDNLYSSSEPMAAEAVRIINAKAQISWATGGHSAGLVPVYACGVGAEEFMGHNDNASIPMKIARIAGYLKE